jgi:Flp pilus assembly protein TadG
MRFRQRRDSGGAGAVEFALVSVFVFPLLFGMIQYGLLFNDYLQVRQGVRQGARTGVVQTMPSCSGATTTGALIKCFTKTQVSPVTGPVTAYVDAPSGWAKGKPLVVCAVVKSAGFGGLIPVPGNGYVKAKTQMVIEVDTPAGTGFPASDGTDPTGGSWTWCS